MHQASTQKRPTRWLTLAVLFLCGSVSAADRLVLVAGGGAEPPGAAATKVKLDGPFGVDFDSQGRMVIVEISGHRVLRVERDGILHQIGGTGEKGNGGDNGPALKAQFNAMHSLAIGKDDAIYIADTLNNRVRKIDPKSGIITAFAGTGTHGDAGDGVPAVKADLGAIYCVAFDATRENLYLVDLDKRKVRKVALKTGLITTVAGNGDKGVPANGSVAVQSPLVDPRAVAVDGRQNIYILERSGHALLRVDPTGKINTVAGTGKSGFLDEMTLSATAALLSGPKHVCIAPDQSSVLIADTDNHVVWRYDPISGTLKRVAGNGKQGTAGLGGDPREAELWHPHGVFFGPDGFLYISDSGNHRILRIEHNDAVRHGRDLATGAAGAVLVADGPLGQTTQIFASGNLAASDAAKQWKSLWGPSPLGAHLGLDIVRLNIYAANDEAARTIRELLRGTLGERPPAVSIVVGGLERPGALVAADVVFANPQWKELIPEATKVLIADGERKTFGADFSVMPPGAKLYISGQAEKGDLLTATRLTLESLERTLKMHGLDKSHAAHVKAFVTPISEGASVRQEIERFFGKGQTPPVSLVEWSSTLPIEIELVAWAGPAREGVPVEYLGAPGLSDSPVYSRAARVNHGPVIFLSGLYSEDGSSGEAEVTGIFSQMQSLLKATGSDLRHLVKATYYVSKDEPSAKLNELRPKYYDPKRPPAASKALVSGTGLPDRGLTLDMIAVPVRSR